MCYFLGGLKDNGQNWCPDCDAFGPTIEKELIAKWNISVIKGIVKDRKSWVVPSTDPFVGPIEHPYKRHPVL